MGSRNSHYHSFIITGKVSHPGIFLPANKVKSRKETGGAFAVEEDKNKIHL